MNRTLRSIGQGIEAVAYALIILAGAILISYVWMMCQILYFWFIIGFEPIEIHHNPSQIKSLLIYFTWVQTSFFVFCFGVMSIIANKGIRKYGIR